MNSKRWQDQFPEEFKQLQLVSVAEGTALLSSALIQEFISEEAYFIWAQAEFGLPLLKKTFFSETDPKARIETWQSFQSRFSWTPECLPFAQWDGHVYVACLEPTVFASQLNAVAILCSAAELQKLWELYTKSAATSVTVSTEAEGSEGPAIIPLVEPSTPELNIPAAIKVSEDLFAGMEEGSPVQADEVKQEETLEIPGDLAGIFDQTVPVTLKLEAPTPQVAADIPPEDILPDTQPSIDLSQLENTPDANSMQAPKTEELSVASESAEIVPTETSRKPTPVSKITAPGIPRPSATVTPTSVHFAQDLDTFFLGKIQANDPNFFKDQCLTAFSELKKYFYKSLLLGADYNGQTLKVIAWNDASAENTAALAIDLRQSSIFKLVDSTQKPFHGAVSPSETNDRFFHDWNSSVVPEIVTLIPCVYNDKVIAMILCLSEANTYGRATLQIATKAAAHFFEKINPATSDAA